MERQSNPAQDADRAFMEFHFYSGGLRTKAFSLSGARPDWAPPPEWVGFRNEFALETDDRVVEVVKFLSDTDPIAWVGVYQAAPDKVYGDRKNHAGFGVWLLNGYPKEPALLVDALLSLLVISRGDDGERLTKKAREFLSAYLEEYVDEYEALSAPFGGLAFAENQVVSTMSRSIDTREKTYEKQLDDLVHRLFYYLPEKVSENSRALLLLTAKDRSRELAAADNERGKLVSDLLKQLPIAMRAQSHNVAGLEQELARDRALLEELDRTRDRLEADLMSARKQANEAEARLHSLKASLEADDELKRFSLLQTGIAEVNSSVSQLQRQLGSLRQEIVNDLRRSSERPTSSAFSGNELRQKIVSHEPMRTSKVSNSGYGSNWWFYGLLIAFSAALVSLLIWAIILR